MTLQRPLLNRPLLKRTLWKRAAVLFVMLLIGGLATVLTPNLTPTKEERFGLELTICQEAWAAGTPEKCQLYGRIQIVDSFPDVKVQEVNAFADLRVQWVDAFADGPGRWQEVNSFPDYRVQLVDAFPDYRVEFVNAFPGCD